MFGALTYLFLLCPSFLVLSVPHNRYAGLVNAMPQPQMQRIPHQLWADDTVREAEEERLAMARIASGEWIDEPEEW